MPPIGLEDFGNSNGTNAKTFSSTTYENKVDLEKSYSIFDNHANISLSIKVDVLCVPKSEDNGMPMSHGKDGESSFAVKLYMPTK